jgi:hypothetical protein
MRFPFLLIYDVLKKHMFIKCAISKIWSISTECPTTSERKLYQIRSSKCQFDTLLSWDHKLKSASSIPHCADVKYVQFTAYVPLSVRSTPRNDSMVSTLLLYSITTKSSQAHKQEEGGVRRPAYTFLTTSGSSLCDQRLFCSTSLASSVYQT